MIILEQMEEYLLFYGDENDPIRDVVENKEKCIVVNNNSR